MDHTAEEKRKKISDLMFLFKEYVLRQHGITLTNDDKIETAVSVLTYLKLIEITEILEQGLERIFSFESRRNFNNFNNVRGNNNGSITINSEDTDHIRKLYDKQILLYEKLLTKTETELSRYKEKFGEL